MGAVPHTDVTGHTHEHAAYGQMHGNYMYTDRQTDKHHHHHHHHHHQTNQSSWSRALKMKSRAPARFLPWRAAMKSVRSLRMLGVHIHVAVSLPVASNSARPRGRQREREGGGGERRVMRS
jgi:hypothetical protein